MKLKSIITLSLSCLLIFGNASLAIAAETETTDQQIAAEANETSEEDVNTSPEDETCLAEDSTEEPPAEEGLPESCTEDTKAVINENAEPQTISEMQDEELTLSVSKAASEGTVNEPSLTVAENKVQKTAPVSYKPALKDVNGILYYFDETGKINKTFNGFIKKDNNWWYVKNGKADKKTTGIVSGKVNGKSAQWNIVNSKVTPGPTVVHSKSGWLYIDKEGKVNMNFTGFAKNSNGWWYVKKGKVDFKTTSVIKGTVNGRSAWWNVKNSKVTAGPTVSHNSNGWWYINKSGYVDFRYNGFAKNSNGNWYCKNGKVGFNVTNVIKGTVNGKSAWWYVKNSKVTGGPTLQKNKNGCWYIDKAGKVDFSYTGVTHNRNGWWYVKNGKVRYDYTGFGKNKNGTWYCVKGKVTFSQTNNYYGTVNGKSGWWFVRNGKVIKAANSKLTSNYLTRRKGVVYFNGHRETFYSQRVLSGSGLRIPGRHVSSMDGTVRDKDDYICVASNDHRKGTVLKTSLGYAKVYDSGCASGTIDIYCNW